MTKILSKEENLKALNEAETTLKGLQGTLTKKEEKTNSYDPDAAANRMKNFSSALNVAIGKAREQRKDSTLDFLGGIIPKGAVSATSFASVLSAFDADSAPLEATLIDKAASFTEDQIKVEQETRNQIRDLALAVAEAGGKQEVIASVLSFTDAGDVDGALKAAGAALSAASGDIRTIGGNLVKVEKDGTYKVLFSSGGSGSGGGNTTTKKTPDGTEIYNDTTGLSAAEAKEYIKSHVDPMFYTSLDGKHTDAEIRSFYEYWMTKNSIEKMTIRADLAYSEWLADLQAAGQVIGIQKDSKSDTKKTDDKKEPWELDYET